MGRKAVHCPVGHPLFVLLNALCILIPDKGLVVYNKLGVIQEYLGPFLLSFVFPVLPEFTSYVTNSPRVVTRD